MTGFNFPEMTRLISRTCALFTFQRQMRTVGLRAGKWMTFLCIFGREMRFRG